MRVLLCGGKGGMAEQLLDRAQIGAGGEQMRGESVAQGVWRDGGRKACRAQAGFQEPRHRACCQPSAARVDEQRLTVGTGVVLPLEPAPPRGARGKVIPQRFLRLLAEGNDALLSSLSDDARQARGEVHVLQVQPRRLRDAQSGRVEKFEERPFPFRKGILLARVEQGLGVSQRYSAKQRLGDPRSRQALGRALRQVSLAARPAKERPQARKMAREGAVGEVLAMEGSQVRTHSQRVDRGEWRLRRLLVGELVLPEAGKP